MKLIFSDTFSAHRNTCEDRTVSCKVFGVFVNYSVKLHKKTEKISKQHSINYSEPYC